jgi:glycosyltransferase involved in cell wall biosynthesis
MRWLVEVTSSTNEAVVERTRASIRTSSVRVSATLEPSVGWQLLVNLIGPGHAEHLAMAEAELGRPVRPRRIPFDTSEPGEGELVARAVEYQAPVLPHSLGDGRSRTPAGVDPLGSILAVGPWLQTSVQLRTKPPPRPRLSVAVRTQMHRPITLVDALLSLAAQQLDDPTSLEVLLLVHQDDPAMFDAARQIVDGFELGFAVNVIVRRVEGGGRSRPLNTAIEMATGTHLAFLDDDDVVSPDWAATFLAGADASPHQIVRSLTAGQRCRWATDATGIAYPEAIGDPEVLHDTRFDLLAHIASMATPICSMALPLAAIRRLGLSFDDQLAVFEDWDMLLRLAPLVGVHDTGKVTSLYRLWDDKGSLGLVGQQRVVESMLRMRTRANSMSFVLPPGGLFDVLELLKERNGLRDEVIELRARLDELRAPAD